jgi:hypothetical protein
MIKKLLSKIKSKTLTELEMEAGVKGEVVDIPDRYLGSPQNKKFYREGEVNYSKMRARFNALAKRLGLNP